jgi:TonB-dependent starch-binding outer membrane protein SusC
MKKNYISNSLKWLFSFGLFLCTFVYAHAQDMRVSGKITDATGDAVAGASIQLKGTTRGTLSGADGTYSISAPSNGTLVVSFVGTEKQEIAIAGRSMINVSLANSAETLDEAVVIGYGTVKKKDLVGAVGTAKAKDFGEVTATNAAALIQGKIAGVQVVNNNGNPGEGAKIFIRGTGSFTSAEPLYVIDGIQGGDINSVPWQDIEDMTVLKDASSVAIYGAKAANGVVIVTTKKGKSGEPRISFQTQYGVSKTRKRFDLLNAAQYKELAKESASFSNGAFIPTNLQSAISDKDGADWQSEIFRDSAPQKNIYFNMTGGGQNSTYNVSIGHENQDYITKNRNFQRTRLRLSLEQKAGKRFKFGQNLNTYFNAYNGSGGSLSEAIRMPPYATVTKFDNQTEIPAGGFWSATGARDGQDAKNPAAFIANNSSSSRGINTTLQVWGEVQLLDWLKFRTQNQVTNYISFNNSFVKPFQQGPITYVREANQGQSFQIYPLFENFLTADKTFGKLSTNLLLGVTYSNYGRQNNISVRGTDILNNEIQNVSVAKTQTVQGVGLTDNGNVGYGHFARTQFVYDNKYILNGSIRRDYSTNFAPGNRIGYFPSVGAAWKISEEAFFKNQRVISDLKLRASWGQAGNDRIGQFRYLSGTYNGGYGSGGGNNIGYSLGDGETYTNGVTISQLVSKDLKWEETTQWDLGLDGALLNNRLNFGIDYYNRLSADLLVNVNVPASTGAGNVDQGANPPLALNAASVLNKGLEFSVGYRGALGPKFRYNVNANLAINENEVTSLGTDKASPIIGGSFEQTGAITRTDKGGPIGKYWGYVVDHVAIDQADVDKYNAIAVAKTSDPKKIYQDGLLPGDIIFKDLDGNGIVDAKDQTTLGSPIPKVQYGGNIDMSYGNLDLAVGLVGVSGVEIINTTIFHLEGTNKLFNAGTGVLDRWKKPGDIAKNPKAFQNNSGTRNLRPSDRFLEDGDYLRVRNITLGYNVPKLKGSFGSKLTSVRAYVTLQNYITFTKFTGLDPEVLTLGGTSDYDVIFNRGLAGYTTPQPKTILVGLNFGF